MAAKAAGRVQKGAQPEGRVRRSQMVTSYGPGALVDLLDHAVLVGGLDFWRWDRAAGRPAIPEPRLRDALDERFRQAGHPLSQDQAFFEPPIGDDQDPSWYSGIPALEFPRWFVCQNPTCRALIRKDHLVLRSGRYQHSCDGNRTTRSVPIRFVAACRRGHVDDFPWIGFVHREAGGSCAAPSLRLEEGASGDFSEIVARCSACGQRAPLSAAMAEGLAFSCNGERPWLGREGREDCTERLHLLVRTASHSYFAQTVSALSIPEVGRELEERVRSVWDVLRTATRETLPAFRTIPKASAALGDASDRDVLALISALQRGLGAPREPLRTAEFRQLASAKAEIPGELPGFDDLFFARTARPVGELPPGVGRPVLVSKLREVRVQIGFSRLEAVTPDLQGEFGIGVESAPLGLTTDWLPATEIRGEGIFLALEDAAVRAWEQRAAVRVRAGELLAGYQRWEEHQHFSADAPPFPGIRFYLLHSLSHLLLTAISLECGYAASAIRERIYCSRPEDSVPMAAVLLSTGTSGSEGTLGGLVEQGRELRGHLRRAFDFGRLCSNDPVCATHTPKDDYAERFLEGAACHGCLFIAECSCERFNRYLDRALVVPTIGHDPELAFFGMRP